MIDPETRTLTPETSSRLECIPDNHRYDPPYQIGLTFISLYRQVYHGDAVG